MLALGDVDDALANFRRALDLSEQSGNSLTYAYALRHLGYAHYTIGQPEAALNYLLELLNLNVAIEFPRLAADVMSDVAAVYVSLGQYEEALGYLERAVPLHRSSAYRTGEARSLFYIARAEDGRGNLESALDNLDSAISMAESLRSEVVSQELRASYVASVHDYYRLQVDLLMRTHATVSHGDYAAAAFEASERARARSLVENLALTGVNLRDGVDEALLSEEMQLRAAVNEQYRKQVELSSRNAASDDLAALESEMMELEAAYEQIQATIRERSPQYAAISESQPLTLVEAQQQVLDESTLLLEYALGDDRSYLWAVSTDDAAAFILPPRKEIDDLARKVYAHLQRPSVTPSARRSYLSDSQQLSNVLLGPVADRLTGMRVAVVADGALRYIPFAALPVPGTQNSATTRLIDEHEVVNLPSASALAVMRDETRNRPLPPRALAMLADPVFSDDDRRLADNSGGPIAGSSAQQQWNSAAAMSRNGSNPPSQSTDGGGLYFPRLQHTAIEADRILESVSNKDFLVQTGFDANRETAISPHLGEYRVLHFATHAVFNENEPGLSGLILSRVDQSGQPIDGFVRLNDIYHLRLPAELVVLSACDTALGDEIEGEGLIGIVRGFMYAGSKRVVASLWQVADAATTELMSRFYHEMYVEGRSPSDALRRAQLHVSALRQWRHPYYWAAFTLQGEWRDTEGA